MHTSDVLATCCDFLYGISRCQRRCSRCDGSVVPSSQLRDCLWAWPAPSRAFRTLEFHPTTLYPVHGAVSDENLLACVSESA